MIPNSKIIDLVLKEFQEVLVNNLERSWQPEHGDPPKYGYIEHTEFVEDVTGHCKGKPISAWYISRIFIKATTIKQGERSFQIKGMFYNIFLGHFCFAPDGSSVFINWVTGPRFGRGYKHRIGIDTKGDYLLDKGSPTWFS
jgi:hypothetical protein